jgi:uncharacterized membrane protein
LFPVKYIPTQKRVKNMLLWSHYISHLWCWDVGFAVAGWITDNYKMLDGTTNWQMVWIIPAGIALVFLLFALLFDSRERNSSYLIR